MRVLSNWSKSDHNPIMADIDIELRKIQETVKQVIKKNIND